MLLPKLTTAVPVAVSDSVLSVSSVRAVAVSTTAIQTSPRPPSGWSPTRQARNRSAQSPVSVEDEMSPSGVFGDHECETQPAPQSRRRRKGDGAVRQATPTVPAPAVASAAPSASPAHRRPKVAGLSALVIT